MRVSLGLVGWAWSGMVCPGRFGGVRAWDVVGPAKKLPAKNLCCPSCFWVWGGRVGVGRSGSVLEGLGLVGSDKQWVDVPLGSVWVSWRWWVWGWRVGVGRSGSVLEGLGLVGSEKQWVDVPLGSGLVGAGSDHRRIYVALAAFGFGVGGLGLVRRSLCSKVWGRWVQRSSGSICLWVRGW